MNKSRCMEKEVVVALRQGESGMPVREVWRKLQVTGGSFCRWKLEHGTWGGELREVNPLEEENQRWREASSLTQRPNP